MSNEGNVDGPVSTAVIRWAQLLCSSESASAASGCVLCVLCLEPGGQFAHLVGILE